MKTILIVDDAHETSEVLSLILRIDGYQVFCASNGFKGLEKAAEVKPDLIMLDFMMPAMNGATMGEILRNDESFAGIRIVMHSCLPEDVVARQFGRYDAFLRKPYDIDIALDLIRDLIEAVPVDEGMQSS